MFVKEFELLLLFILLLLRIDPDLDFDDLACSEFIDHDREIFEIERLRLFWNFSELLDNPTADGLRVEISRFVFVDIKFFEEIIEFRTTVYEIIFIVDFGEVVDNFVVFVPNLAYEFFKDVFEGDYTQRSAVLVNDNSHMHFLALHAFEQCGYLHMLGCHRNRRYVIFYVLLAFFKSSEEVDVVDHANDLIDGILVDGQSLIVVFEENCLDFVHRHIGRHGNDVDSRNENVLHFAVVKFYCARNKLALL